MPSLLSFSPHSPYISGAETWEGRPNATRCAPLQRFPPLDLAEKLGRAPGTGLFTYLAGLTSTHWLSCHRLQGWVNSFSLGFLFSRLVFESLALGGGSHGPWALVSLWNRGRPFHGRPCRCLRRPWERGCLFFRTLLLFFIRPCLPSLPIRL